MAVGNKMPDETIEILTKGLLALPKSVIDVKELDYIGFKVLSDEAYDQFRRIINITKLDGNK